MKTKLLSLIACIVSAFTVKAQCTATQTIGLVVSTTASVSISDPFTIKVCSTGFVHDTTGNNGRMYYMESGSQVRLKMHSTTLVYMQTASTLTISGPGTVVIYKEPGATVIGIANTTNTCSAVSFPASPACAPTGIKEQFYNGRISAFPNPAKDQLNIHSENFSAMNGNLINALGQTVRSFSIEGGNKTLNISDLNSGIYYLTVSEKGKTISCGKIVVVK